MVEEGLETLPEKDLELVHLLQIAPRISWAQAGEILGAHATVLAARWDRLAAAGIAWVTAQPTARVRPQVLSFTELGSRPGARERVISALMEMPEVMSLDVLSRNHDLVLTIMDTSLAHLVESVYPQLTEMDGVTGLSSMVSVAMHSPASNWRLQSLDRRQVEAAQAIHREQVRRDPHVRLGPEHGPVIELLQRDGRCSAAEVARVTGTSPATARRRLSRVLASDTVSLRCDMAQPASGFPVTVQWFTRLPMSEHLAAATALANGLNMRMIVSATGRANFLLTMWLPSANDLFATERNIERLTPGIEILETSLLLGSRKRLGWIIRADGTTDGRVVVPPVSLG